MEDNRMFEKASIEEHSDDISMMSSLLEIYNILERMPCTGDCVNTKPYLCDRCLALKIVDRAL